MPPAIETHALTKRFRRIDSVRDLLALPWRVPGHVAVDSVTLTIGQGELFGLLGQNGAGKTTLIRMLSTALLPSSGSARVAGHDVVREARRVREAIALVPSDDRSFFARLTGRQNLEFFAALRDVGGARAQRRIAELLERVDLAGHADVPFRAYSSGMRQKLGIARGLLADPAVLFLDEPSRSLDPISAREVRRLVSEFLVGELGRTVVLATHSLAEAEALCDRLALVRGGRVVAQGSVEQLRRAFPHGVRCDVRLADVPPPLPATLRDLPGVIAVDLPAGERGGLLRLSLEEEGAVLAGVLRAVVEHGGEIHGCTTRQASLEDIYVSALGGASTPEELVAC
jgi:ABC-2 type transport system ATP-binding protein